MTNNDYVMEIIKKQVMQLQQKFISGGLDQLTFSKKIDELTLYLLLLDRKGFVINEYV